MDVGLLYAHGIAVPLNPLEASAWFERAYALGEPLAAAGLAWCAIDGCKTPPDAAGAKRWLAPLRSVNSPRAQYLQWLIETKLATLQVASLPQQANTGAENAIRLHAKTLLLNAAQRGDVQANIELGFDSLGAGRPVQALEFFKVAAPRSTIAATNAELVADILAATPNATADRLVPDTDKAEATLAQVRRNHRDNAQPANFVEAIRLYRLAQSQGSQTARKILELIFSRPGADGQVDIAWMQQLAYVDVSGTSPVFPGVGSRRILRKEPTPIFDLLPLEWRTEVGDTIGTQPRQ
jgi:TPR repeat protein